MKFYFNGKWSDGTETIPVLNPFDQSVVDTVPAATPDEVDQAISGAVVGKQAIAKMSGYDRSKFLRKASELIAERQADLSRTISLEEGKTLRESRSEVNRAIQTMELSADEAKRLGGEVLPLDGTTGCHGKFGYMVRIPCGVVAAITPFNYPLNLVCHKVGPALAAGNSVIIKPASDTPLVALKFVEILLEAGCPPDAIACITGSGSKVGAQLCGDPRIRKISFTGSKPVGEAICKMSGIKRVTMELGSNSPLVVLPDADMNKVIKAIVVGGFSNAGQVCISAQRVIAHEKVYEELTETLRDRIPRIRAGDQLQKNDIGPMVRESDAVRVESWIKEAVEQGAEVMCGGERNQSVITPTVLTKVTPQMKVVSEELFGPAVGVMQTDSIDEAIAQANDTPFGLSAAVYTQNIDAALRFAKFVESGNVHINGGPLWRTDIMPYGGIKGSGIGKEGPKYAIHEMTELKTVIIHSNS